MLPIPTKSEIEGAKKDNEKRTKLVQEVLREWEEKKKLKSSKKKK